MIAGINEIKKLPTSYALLWFKLSFKLIKKNYLVCFLAYLGMMILMALATSLPPYFAAVISSLVFVISGLCFLEIGRLMLEQEEVNWQSVFALAKNSEKLRQLSPLIILVILCSVLSSSLEVFGDSSGVFGLVGVLLSQILLALISFLVFGLSLPLMVYKNLSLTESIRWNLSYIFANLKVFLLFSGLYLVFVFASVLLLLLPLFFILGPLTVPLAFIVYSSVFDDFEPDHALDL